ncbi:uncharacterized protein [Rutidosis leptorrhynchoides]|uniref:uncharacterized protein n=1 Tax=Rutidosis leptorrhynchoides TaxID=125765 RepID=UPI003A99A6BC
MERNIALDDESCCLCGASLEDMHHLFLQCNSSQLIWAKVAQWVNLNIPVWSLMDSMWAWIDGVPIQDNKRLIMMVIVYSTLWSIWRLRNSYTFRDQKFRKCHVMDNIVVNGFNWLFARFKKKKHVTGRFGYNLL